MTAGRTLALIVAFVLASPSAAGEGPLLAIIIDDIGYAANAGRRAVALPGPVAYAVLPDAPHARGLAEAAHARGKEVLLHLPMQAVEPLPREPSGGLSLETTEIEFERRINEYLALVPYVSGVNNHQGSLLTRHPGHMQWLMNTLKGYDGLYFVDSYTTAASVALSVADENRVPATRRDVFLDGLRGAAQVRAELERAIGIAMDRGAALAIGHPYPETLAVLEAELPALAERGIELVPVRRLIEARLSGRGAAGPAEALE